MSSNQGDLQASARAVSGTTSTFESDMLSMFSTQGVTSGAYNERLLQWINLQLGASFTSLPMAQNAFAASMGADTWNGLGTINSDYAPDGVGPACRADFRRQFFTLNGSVVPFSSIINLTSSSKWVIGPSGTLVQVAANTPAYDYSSGLPRLVLEGASTNLVSYSSAIGGTGWSTTGGNNILNAASAPDGTNSATRRIAGSTIAIRNLNATLVSGNVYTWSVWVKSANGQSQTWAFWVNNADNVVTVPAYGWARISLTLLYSGTGSLFDFYPLGNSGDIYMWGAQVEKQSFASSYIPTTATSVTRTADSAQLTTAAAALLQASAASVVVRGAQYGRTNGRILGGAGSNALIYAPSTTTVAANNTATLTATAGSGAVTTQYGAAYAANGSGRSLAVNGGSVASDANTIGSITSAFLANDGAATAFGDGLYDELVIWPARLTNTSLQNQARVWK